MARTLKELLAAYKKDPGSLTPGELEFVRREIRKLAKRRDGYEKKKLSSAERSREEAKAGRDIGELPPVGDNERRAKAKTVFRSFCETYFPRIFYLPWSLDHLKVITKVEQAVLHGGLFALAMPRGSGKTCIAKCACLWAVLYGHRDFVCLIGASEVHAAEMLGGIKTELENNDFLASDFPEAVVPIRSLEGIANRCSGQLYKGQRTDISWTANEIILPTMRLPGEEGWQQWKREDGLSFASGAIITVTGITGRIRGLNHARPDGQTVRPSLVVLDDPQTDESARSLSQCATRERIIAGAVLGLAGPGRKISGIMPCTVISPGDVADHILDQEKHPDWNGERTKMVYKFPTNEKLWARYAEARAESFRVHGDIKDATAFYQANREKLDAGAVIAWPERFNHDEASAVQHAMNLKLQNERAFFAEYQNEPMPEKGLEDEEILSAEEISEKLNGYKRREVPIGANHVVMFIDVQGKLLYYAVAAFEEDFTGYILDYGTYPGQRRQYFTLRDASRTLKSVAPKAGKEGAIRAGLEALTADYLGREWRRDDGAHLRIERCLMDAGWEPDVVYEFCRKHPLAAVLMPSRGQYVGARHYPFAEHRKQKGDRVGHHWRTLVGARAIRHALYDTNYWKTFLHARLSVPLGDHGCLSLFGRRGNRSDIEGHQMFAEHLTAEYREKTEGRAGVVDEWSLRPNGGDNHWFDCMVGCCVAASMQNVALPGTGGEIRKRIRRRRSYAEWQQEVRNRQRTVAR